MARKNPTPGLIYRHGAYYLSSRPLGLSWHPLGRNQALALAEYARIMSAGGKGGMDDFLDRALAEMRTNIKPTTAKNYARACGVAKRAFREFSPQQVRPVDVAALLDHKADAPGFSNVLRTFLKNAFALGVRWGVVEANPVRDLKPFRTKARTRYITDEEFAAIYANATPVLQCLMDLAYITGQRIGDLLKIRLADLAGGEWVLTQEKTGHKERIVITPDFQAVIDRARVLHQDVRGLTLFSNKFGGVIDHRTINKQWLHACRSAGVEDAHFHDLRRAAATDARAQGADSQALLGHKDARTHRIYLSGDRATPVQPIPKRGKK